jgi:hypothetical protein
MLSIHQLLNPLGGAADTVSSARVLPLATRSNSPLADTSIPLSNPPHTTQFHVNITRETTLEALHTYPLNTSLEYPETSSTGRIGHLFTLDASDWTNPVHDFMYSQGPPKGQSKKSETMYCNVLVNEMGVKVPCRVSHSTCMSIVEINMISCFSSLEGQGGKACPYTDRSVVTAPHCRASRELLRSRLEKERESRLQSNSPIRDVYEKTLSLWSALTKTGCGAPRDELTIFSGTDLAEHNRHKAQLEATRRGHDTKITCNGRLLFEHDHKDNAYIRWALLSLYYTASKQRVYRCEHYNPTRNKDHLIDFDIGKGLYDLEYLEVLFQCDTTEIQNVEDDAYLAGFNPQAACMTVSNFNSLKPYCREWR